MGRWSPLKCALALFASLLIASCGATGPGGDGDGSVPAAPAPPTEVPSFLVFPESLAINVDKISSSPASGSLSAQVVAGDDISEAISGGADLAAAMGTVIDLSIGDTNARLNALQIPVSNTTTTFAGEVDETLFFGKQATQLQLDFADFDFDGDGTKEGCSGHTGALPICYRIWATGNSQQQGMITIRLQAGVIVDQFPTESIPGAGRIKAAVDEASDTSIAIHYDHKDLEAKRSELFLLANNVESGSQGTLFDNIHTSIEQVGPEATAFKAVKVAVEGRFPELNNSPGNGDLKYIGQWREDSNFWSGSVLDTRNFSNSLPTFNNICAAISTGSVLPNRNNCIDLGIDTEGVEFLDFVTADDVTFFDFPTDPTF